MPNSISPLDRRDVADHWRRILARIDAIPDDVTVGISLRDLESGARHDHLGVDPSRPRARSRS